MGKYLDLAYSRKASATSSPNENYPRELMQLFTIGLWELNMDGTPQLDGTEPADPDLHADRRPRVLARADRVDVPDDAGRDAGQLEPAVLRRPDGAAHDDARHGHEDALQRRDAPGEPVDDRRHASRSIDNIFQHANVPPFVATRLIRSLVTSNPSPCYIERVAIVFANNGQGVRGDMKAVIRAVLTDPEAVRFSSADAGRLKDPILHVIGFGRALGARITDPNVFMYVFSNLSQRVLTPTTVFSFYSPLGDAAGRQRLCSDRSSRSIRRRWRFSAPTSSTRFWRTGLARPTPSTSRRSRRSPHRRPRWRPRSITR